MVLRRHLIAALVLGVSATTLALTHPGNGPVHVETCGAAKAIRVGSTIACTHEDTAPKGVDVTKAVSTATLKARPGAGPTAYKLAQDLGVPSTQVATTASDPAVTCDGDGTSGYRVQAMYVVEAGKTNRYSSLLPTFQLWAAGTDDVVNRSAALTGGVRHLRYVTEPGANGTCVAKVLNVTVPAGSMASFNATISAVQALGYTSPGRKYLMWTDATSLCGIATMYGSDVATQANLNNGAYAQYARVDSGCWGLGNGSTEHSVEAHELLHTLGGVQNTAPHSTKAGHCFDESDTMCYADGGSAGVMKQVCPTDHEFFYDCNNDDYFSTYPDPGSYLASHWNAADSRFLIGGGDGAGGGTLGSPTVLGATLAVNNPAVPGLPTQAEVTPALPDGRTLTKVAWRSARSDCVFGSPAQAQTTVTCNATSAAATTVTVTLTDSTGATKSVSSPLTFAAGTARPVRVALAAAAQSTDDGTTASVCTGAPFGLTATVVDVASGLPVKGLGVSFKKKTATMTSPGLVGSAATGLSGSGTVSQVTTVTADYTATVPTGVYYASGTSPVLTAVPGKCAPVLTATASASSIYYADPVTITGTLTRTVGALTVPVAGVALPVKLTSVVGGVTRVATVGYARTGTDGAYAVTVKPTVSGTLSVEVLASAAYTATKVTAGTVSVTVPDTALTAALDKTAVGYGSTVTVTGTLSRVAGSTTTALKGAYVGAYVLPAGKTTPVLVGGGYVNAAGAFTAPVTLRVSGALSVKYLGVPGQPAAVVALGDVTAGTWATALTASASASSVTYGSSVTFTGALTRSYAGVTSPAAGQRVNLVFTATGSTTSTIVTAATTSATGAFTIRIYPRASGTFKLTLANVAGYSNATTGTYAVTVK